MRLPEGRKATGSPDVAVPPILVGSHLLVFVYSVVICSLLPVT